MVCQREQQAVPLVSWKLHAAAIINVGLAPVIESTSFGGPAL